MKKQIQIPGQLVVAALILLGGAVVVGTEYLIVRWYPGHRERVGERTLKLIPYSNPALGVEAEIAAGIYSRVSEFPGGVKIFRNKFWGIGPSLTITSQPNPDKAVEFSPQVLAKWQTQGVYQQIPRYGFEHTKINNRDAVLIWQFKNRAMLLTARVLSPDRVIEAYCTPGQEDETLFLDACKASLLTLKIAGPEPPGTPSSGVRQMARPMKVR